LRAMSNEDERRSVTRKAAAVGLVVVALFEIGLLTWNLASRGYRNGMLEAWDLLELGLFSCVIIAQAGVVWIVVGRDPPPIPHGARSSACWSRSQSFSPRS